jgi:prevent-host-death family protein
MRRINLNQDIKPLSEFRANAASLVKHVHETKRPLVITHRGRSAAVLLDVEEYETLIDQIETLQEIHMAEQEIAEGKGVDHTLAKKRILEGLRK